MLLGVFLSEFREKVKERFKVKRFSAEALAGLIGVDVERYRKWEKGAMPNSEADRALVKIYFGIQNLEDVPDAAIDATLDHMLRANTGEILRPGYVVKAYDSNGEEKGIVTQQNLQQEQVSEGQATPITSAELKQLIQANADQSMAVKDIAAANVALVHMLQEERGFATEHGASQTLSSETSIAALIQEAVRDALVELGYRGPVEQMVKAHRASVGKSE